MKVKVNKNAVQEIKSKRDKVVFYNVFDLQFQSSVLKDGIDFTDKMMANCLMADFLKWYELNEMYIHVRFDIVNTIRRIKEREEYNQKFNS